MSIEDLLDDLKQFIVNIVSLATADMATKDDIASIWSTMATKDDIASIRNDITDLGQQISDLDLKVVTIADANVETFHGHEIRISRLEGAT